jgi:flagellar biosynthesis anti-sigma factor FlgM
MMKIYTEGTPAATLAGDKVGNEMGTRLGPARHRSQVDGQGYAVQGKGIQAEGMDETRFSPAHDYVRLMAADADGPGGVRHDKVQALQRAIGSGTYRVDAGAIAEAMSRELL